MENINIRKLTDSDIDAIMKIDEQITGRTQESFWKNKIATYLSREPNACLAAELDGRLVGFILGEIRGWEFGSPLSGWLEIVGVDNNYQNRGIGKKLVESLMEYFTSCNLPEVRTMINWNDGELIDYFRAQGFERGDYVNMVKEI